MLLTWCQSPKSRSLYGPDLLLLSAYKIKEEHKQLGMFFRQTGIAWHSLEQQVLQVYCVRYTKRLALEQDQALPDGELLWGRFRATSSSGAQNFKVTTIQFISKTSENIHHHLILLLCIWKGKMTSMKLTNIQSGWLGHIWHSRREIFISHTSFFFLSR